MTELAQWTVPAPSWLHTGTLTPQLDATEDDLDAGTLAHPEIIEFSGDDFVDQLRDVLDGGDPQHRRLSAMHPKGPGTEADPWRLFQPLHARYYMVTGSLVCRRAGLPDRAVDRRAGQSASFVVRRVVAGREQAWVPSGRSGAWRDLSDPATLFTTVNGLNGVVAEERHKMQPMTVTASSGTGEVAELFGLDEPGRRQIRVGYLPVVPRVEPRAENGRGAAIVSDANATVSASNQDNAAAKNDPRMMVATIRVLEPWRLLKEGDKNGEVRNDDAYIASFYWLLEMSDLMHQWFPDELAAARRDPLKIHPLRGNSGPGRTFRRPGRRRRHRRCRATTPIQRERTGLSVPSYATRTSCDRTRRLWSPAGSLLRFPGRSARLPGSPTYSLS